MDIAIICGAFLTCTLFALGFYYLFFIPRTEDVVRKEVHKILQAQAALKKRGIPYKVNSGATLVVPRSMIDNEESVEVTSGGFLIILEEGQTPDDASELLAEHERAELERDQVLYHRS